VRSHPIGHESSVRVGNAISDRCERGLRRYVPSCFRRALQARRFVRRGAGTQSGRRVSHRIIRTVASPPHSDVVCYYYARGSLRQARACLPVWRVQAAVGASRRIMTVRQLVPRCCPALLARRWARCCGRRRAPWGWMPPVRVLCSAGFRWRSHACGAAGAHDRIARRPLSYGFVSCVAADGLFGRGRWRDPAPSRCQVKEMQHD